MTRSDRAASISASAKELSKVERGGLHKQTILQPRHQRDDAARSDRPCLSSLWLRTRTGSVRDQPTDNQRERSITCGARSCRRCRCRTPAAAAAAAAAGVHVALGGGETAAGGDGGVGIRAGGPRVGFGQGALHPQRLRPLRIRIDDTSKTCGVAPDETAILLHPPLPLVGVSIGMERGVSRMTVSAGT